MKSSTFLVYILVFLLVGCNKINGQTEDDSSDTEYAFYDSIEKARLKDIVKENYLDTINIAEHLKQKIPTTPVFVYDTQRNVPFLYSYEFEDKVTLAWAIGDLFTMDSEKSIRFENHISYKGEKTGAGNMFFIRNDDPNAVRIESVLRSIEEFAEVLYHDDDSIVYLSHDIVRCLSFKFYSEEGLYYVYYDDTTFKLREENFTVKLYYIIENLRIAKSFWNLEPVESPKSFQEYMDVLNPIIRSSYLIFRDSFSKEILERGIRSDISIHDFNLLKFDKNAKLFWDKLSNHRVGEVITIDSKDLIYSSSLKSFEVNLVYKDKNTLVFNYLSSRDGIDSASFFKKYSINGEEVLFVDKELFFSPYLWKTPGMTMFYLRMLESLPEIK